MHRNFHFDEVQSLKFAVTVSAFCVYSKKLLPVSLFSSGNFRVLAFMTYLEFIL